MPLTLDVLRPCVRRGSELLDRARPGWAKEIHAEELRMESCFDCILGQLFGRWWRGNDKLNLEAAESGDYGFAVQNGMPLGDPSLSKAYDTLGDLWRTEIASRLTPEPS